MKVLNKIVSVEGERQLKFSANRKENNKASLSAINTDVSKQSQMSKVMLTLEFLQAQILALNVKIRSRTQDQPVVVKQSHFEKTKGDKGYARTVKSKTIINATIVSSKELVIIWLAAVTRETAN